MDQSLPSPATDSPHGEWREPTSASEEADAYKHDHRFLGADHVRNERRTRWAALLCLAALVAGLGGGAAFGSVALIAEGLHMFAHVAALGIAAGAYALARRYADDPRFSFGPGKFGDLAAFANAVLLIVMAVVIAWEAVQRILAPGEVHYHGALATAGFALVINAAAAVLLADRHGHGHDLNIRAAYLHVLADVLVSLIALAGLGLGALFRWHWTDPAAGLIGAAVVAHFAFSLLFRSAGVLLDMTREPDLAKRLRARLEREGDLVRDLHVWRLGPGHEAAIVSIVSATPQAPSVYRARMAEVAALSHVTVEVVGR